MSEHCLFIQQEISCMFVDDFCNLPYNTIYRNVIEPLHDAQQRHTDCWSLTH